MATRDTNKAIIREQFFTLNEIIAKATKVKNVYRARLVEIDALSKDYSPEYLQQLQDKARAGIQSVNQTLYEDAEKQIEKLQRALEDMHGQVDLGNPALTNALKLIELAGPELGSENIAKINAQFAGDQASLRLLQSAYKAKGFAWDGGLDKQIYSVDDAISTISDLTIQALQKDGSLNALASFAGKVAKMEGLDFETTPDEAGVLLAMRRGAGFS